jgi:hypothetical protein
VVRSGGG